MKTAHLITLLLPLFAGACSEQKEATSANDANSKQPALDVEAEKVIEEIRDRTRRDLDREQFYNTSPSIEQLIGIPQDLAHRSGSPPVIKEAFVIMLDAQGEVTVKDLITGRLPSDYRSYIPANCSPGTYLLGRLMPKGGWGITGYYGRPEFRMRLNSDESFLLGYENEMRASVAQLRECIITNR